MERVYGFDFSSVLFPTFSICYCKDTGIQGQGDMGEGLLFWGDSEEVSEFGVNYDKFFLKDLKQIKTKQ